MNSRGETPEWQRRLKQKLGENPARFLDHDLVERGNRHTDRTLQRLVRARIRGIDRLEVVNAWIAVERKLDRGPRDRIIDLLEERKVYLEEHGGRPKDLQTEWPQDLPDRYQPANRDRQETETEVYFVRRDASGEVIERTPLEEKRSGTAAAKLQSRRATATDGGEDR